MSRVFKALFYAVLSLNFIILVDFAQANPNNNNSNNKKDCNTYTTSERIIWGKWDCSDCGTKGISAEPPAGETLPKCPNCGSPREDLKEEVPYLDNARSSTGKVLNANVADTKEEIKIATDGEDWFCPYCEAGNRHDTQNCAHCGASRNEKKVETKTYKSQKNSQPTKSRPYTPREKSVPEYKMSMLGKATIAAAVVGTGAAFIYGIHWSQKTHPVEASVESLNWNHRISVDTFVPVTKRDWINNLSESRYVAPMNGVGERAGLENIRNCRSEHYDDETYQCGVETYSERESYQVSDGETCRESCSVKSNKNGSFTESCSNVCTPKTKTEYRTVQKTKNKYCSRPIYQDKCDYTTHAWQNVTNKEIGGNLLNLSSSQLNEIQSTKRLAWPEVNLGILDRATRSESYEVKLKYFDDDGKLKYYALDPNSENEFLNWKPDSRVTLEINNLGSIKSWKPIK